MLQRRSCSKRGRSAAQFSHISSLNVRHHELVLGGGSGTLGDSTESSRARAIAGPEDAMLVNRLKEVKQDLENSRKREKRAKEKSMNCKDKLAVLTRDNHLIQGALYNAEKTLNYSYEALEGLENQNTLLVERCTALEISESLIREFCNELQVKETQLHDQVARTATLLAQTRVNADHEIQVLRKRTHALELSKDAARKKICRISERHTRALSDTLADSKAEPVAQEMKLKDKQGSIRPVIRDLVRKLIAENHVGTEHISSIITNVTAAFNIIIVDTISARSVSRIVLEGLIQAKIQLAYEMNRAECMQQSF